MATALVRYDQNWISPSERMVTATEIAERARDIIRATGLSLIVDIDTGYGGVLEVARTAREMTEAVNAPLLANMTECGRTPYFTEQQFWAFGYQVSLTPFPRFA
ncbi:hypothetical protein [Sulfobacillus harzensis]|uniref:Uncharacterized protein n=1 Tax=Sulfobacillus harzensis TaxID=2729629 RepID=A0A7Y0L4C6_9FIRM|nr:hypothetical protein [Sulfobacillus harzensis]NMP23099.1 hypothetical protein [Sulfobacillus harzensis]